MSEKKSDEELKEIQKYTGFTNSEVAFKRAEEQNMRVVLPDEYTLQLDIDNDEAYKQLTSKLKVLRAWHYYPTIVKDAPSKSGLPHRHVYIRVTKELTQIERIVLQQYLGSDPVREFLNFQRVLLGDTYATLFFEPKEQVM